MRTARHDSSDLQMLIDEVEAIWAAIAERDDWSPLQAENRRYPANMVPHCEAVCV